MLFPIESTPVPPEPPEVPLTVVFFPLLLSLVSLGDFSIVAEEDMVCNIAFASMVAWDVTIGSCSCTSEFTSACVIPCSTDAIAMVEIAVPIRQPVILANVTTRSEISAPGESP